MNEKSTYSDKKKKKKHLKLKKIVLNFKKPFTLKKKSYKKNEKSQNNLMHVNLRAKFTKKSKKKKITAR